MHMHHHGDAHVHMDPVTQKKARIILASIVVPLLVLTVVGLLVLYPYSAPHVKKAPYLANGITRAVGVVVDTPVKKCLLPQATVSDTSLLKNAVCARITQGQGKGLVVPVHLPPENKAIVHPGSTLKLFFDASQLQQGTPYLFEDFQRTVPVFFLIALYFVLVLLVAGRRGGAAVVGLLTSCLVIFFFILPALMAGKPALLVTLVGAGAMMFLSVYLAHGVTIRTTTALLGTLIGLAITLFLAVEGVSRASLTGATSDDALNMMTYFPDISLSALLTCGIVIAGLGALNDVAITQASAVWELFEANPTTAPWRLFGRAMRIGRDHIASTVYTLAFAYAGTALPTFILASTVQRPFMDLVMTSTIAEELVRTMVASIGLVLAIPITTLIGTVLVTWTHKVAAGESNAGDGTRVEGSGGKGQRATRPAQVQVASACGPEHRHEAATSQAQAPQAQPAQAQAVPTQPAQGQAAQARKQRHTPAQVNVPVRGVDGQSPSAINRFNAGFGATGEDLQ